MKRIISLVAALLLVVSFTDWSNSANDVAGTYISKQNKNEYITFAPDGKFFLKQQKKPYDFDHPYITVEGVYTLSGDAVSLKLSDGGEAEGKFQEGAFVDNQGIPWLKDGKAPKKDMPFDPKKRYSN